MFGMHAKQILRPSYFVIALLLKLFSVRVNCPLKVYKNVDPKLRKKMTEHLAFSAKKKQRLIDFIGPLTLLIHT